MLRNALLILSGNATSSLLLLMRNLIVARLIPVSDYGVAATFAIVMAGVEMASSLGLQQQIVQAKSGNEPRFQATLQAFQLVRGVLAGALLFFLAGPMAAFFGIPEVAWAYQILAIIPVLKALVHFDVHRLHRQMRFGPSLLSNVIPAAFSLALVWPLTWLFGDWKVMLYSLLVQAILIAAVSHFLAERRYELAWDTQIIAGSLRFGWPLLVNTGLMFLVFQGDKMIVGRLLGIEALAIFAMGVTLTLTPTLVLAKTSQNLFLPRVSRIIRNKETDHRLLRHTMEATLMYGVSVMVFFIIFGDGVVNLILTDAYSDLTIIIGSLSILFGVRVFKSGLSTISLATGKTLNNLISNIPRLIGLIAAYFVLQNDGTLVHIIWIGIFSEFIGYLVFAKSLLPYIKKILPRMIFTYACLCVIILNEMTKVVFEYSILSFFGQHNESAVISIFFAAFLISLTLIRDLLKILYRSMFNR